MQEPEVNAGASAGDPHIAPQEVVAGALSRATLSQKHELRTWAGRLLEIRDDPDLTEWDRKTDLVAASIGGDQLATGINLVHEELVLRGWDSDRWYEAIERFFLTSSKPGRLPGRAGSAAVWIVLGEGAQVARLLVEAWHRGGSAAAGGR